MIVYAVSLLVIAYLGYQTYLLQRERFEIRDEFGEIRTQHDALQADNERLGEDLEYLADPHNLEKELRARFNYRLPSEKLIIVVPEEESGE